MTLDESILRLLSCHGPMLTRQLIASVEKHPNTVTQACQVLREHALITTSKGQHSITAAGCKLLEAGGPFPYQRKGKASSNLRRSLRQRAWNIMRMVDHFTVSSLMQTICDGDEAAAEYNLSTYCSILYRTGFLGKTKRTRAYFLKIEANTGPLSPSYNRITHTMTDRNTGKIYDIEITRGPNTTIPKPTPRQMAWEYMRTVPSFSVKMLIGEILNEPNKHSRKYLTAYLNALIRAGFLGKTTDDALYLLPNFNTGPLAPIFTWAKHSVTDRNTGKVYPLERVR